MREKRLSNLLKNTSWRNVTRTLVLLIAIALLLIVIRPILMNPSTYTRTSSYLDEKMANATELSLGAASASFVVSLLPNDTGSPIAEKLAEFSSYMLLVVSTIFLERFLLTTIGFVSSTFILPAACACYYFSLLAQPENSAKLKEYSYRLLIVGLCVVLIMPLGCACGKLIEDANQKTIETALQDAQNANSIVDSLPVAEKNKNVFDKIGDFFSSLWKSATEAYDWAKTVLNDFMVSVAVMMVTTIAVPVLMLFCFIWLIKFLMKQDYTVSVIQFAGRFAKRAKIVPINRNDNHSSNAT